MRVNHLPEVATRESNRGHLARISSALTTKPLSHTYHTYHVGDYIIAVDFVVRKNEMVLCSEH